MLFAYVLCPSIPSLSFSLSKTHRSSHLLSLSLSPARRALLCFLVLFIPSDGGFAARRYTWEAHLGYSCAAVIAASCVGRWVSVCVFCMHVFMLCIRVCGGICLSGAAIWGRSSHLGLQMSLPLHIVLKLLSAASLCVLALPPSLPLALCWCLSLAHCCVTISHRHCSERIGRDPTSWGVEGCMCTCLENMAAVRPSILQACFVHVSVRARVWETEVIYVLQFVRTCKERDIGFGRKLLRAVLPH